VRGGGGAAGEHADAGLSGEATIRLRRARPEDVAAIVAMLADDPLGAAREDVSRPLAECYRRAFDAIAADPNQLLAVAEAEGDVVGTLQITLIPGLSREGALRGQIEAVRVASGHQSRGFGRRMVEWAIAECRARGCAMVQLTTDRSRNRAHAFYERLGFEPSHVGYKLTL
jgi:GNAT superfamily N-acetyltransferase